ncbi:MAG: hypothetical protein J6X05_00580 [Bacteroidales bacterium]|nr:hypothetical protein [Bacteroidales bacterium]
MSTSIKGISQRNTIIPVHTYYVNVSLPFLYVVYKVAKFTDCRRYVNKNVLGISIVRMSDAENIHRQI